MVQEKPVANLPGGGEAKTVDSSTTTTDSQNASPMQKPTKDPSNPVPDQGEHSHPGLSAMPHMMTDKRILEELGSNREQGLNQQQVTAATEKYGPNIIQPPKKPSFIKVVLRQVVNAMTLVLIAAMAVSFGTQDFIAGGVIAALVILNVTVGASQVCFRAIDLENEDRMR